MLLPRPLSEERLPGRFTLTSRMVLHADSAALPAATLLAGYLENALGAVTRTSTVEGSIRLRVADLPHARGNAEAYRIHVSERGIELTGQAREGLLHAVQTFRQLLPPTAAPTFAPSNPHHAWDVPCVMVLDAPRLRWRGLMLDVARHFTPVAGVLRLLDLMALHRLNVMQLHLTDDQGWRLEIAKYPRLTEIGGRRKAAPADPADPSCRATGPAHEGWYTRSDIHTIITHAARRGITVVPEIEQPGHVQAALAAYPGLGNNPRERVGVWDRWGINDRTVNAEHGTLGFFTDVLDEVMDMFPSAYVHLGGDECSTQEWDSSPAAVARAKELGLAGTGALSGWMMRCLADHLSGRGRRAVGWDEVADGPLRQNTVVMSWHGAEVAESAAERGFDVVLAPWRQTYFDLHQSAEGEPRAQKGVLTLADSYAFDPFTGRFDADLSQRLLGVQCQLWTEYIASLDHLEYMAFPRVCAFAERAWGHGGDYSGFLARLPSHLRRLDGLGVRYRRPTAEDMVPVHSGEAAVTDPVDGRPSR
ncbi:beta-N-acetylhexosaminidase [Wenjunlia tyrosinilytica]|uniref:beta-N-acetylhexosaminidase n=1 Tax=Wenjunlia tyrosinilytica TaxID=1544741 RepID=A0A917ZSQ7_9ACTN|nr:beta-N-acetylhexosaminidase [Wenjunlia tyrosinilytica]GGO91648.1 beta-hexosaminidase [Wenjunlia tyrosinilytica]